VEANELSIAFPKHELRVTHLGFNPVDANLLLTCLASKRDQFVLTDLRRPASAVLTFGIEQTENQSMYVTPSWSPDGVLVASGSSALTGIRIFDIRFAGNARGRRGTGSGEDGSACQCIPMHSKRVLRVAFHPRRSCMVSVSSDPAMGFLNYVGREGS
jgi:WD40 repeat protein